VLWLGALIFLASMAGCVLMIVLGVRFDDASMPTAGGVILTMPVKRP